MTDAELELACAPQYPGISPWAYWTSEIYSFGKCLRFWTKYPTILPLFVYSDHGVGLYTHLFPHELENRAKIHFTWHPRKEQKHNNLADRKVLQIMHPWISYRVLRGITRSNKPKGTLVFLLHSTPSIQLEGHDTEEYFSSLRDLPEKFQPVVLCLHMHDINAGYHKELRRHGFPIVTVGNASSTRFVDRFYDLVKNYSYATSQAWATPIAYCIELGIPCFFLGDKPKVFNISDKNMPAGEITQGWDKCHVEYFNKANALFQSPVDRVTSEQRAFVESLLGFDSHLTRWQVSWILWREFFCSWRQWNPIFKSILTSFYRKIRTLRTSKRR